MSAAETATEVKDAGRAPACAYDLTMKFVKYLDPHMSLVMIEFIESKNIYPPVEVAYAKMKMLLKTFLVAKAEETFAKLKELNAPKEQIEQLEGELANMKKRYEEEKTAVEQMWETQKTVFENEELIAVLNGTRKIEERSGEGEGAEEEEVVIDGKLLSKNYRVNPLALSNLYRYARFVYNTGSYETALTLQQKFLDFAKYFEAEVAKYKDKVLWGKLACDVLLNRTAAGFADLEVLRGYISSQERESTRTMSHLQLLYMRVWLLHWSVFVYLRTPDQDGKDKLVELFSNISYMNAIQTEAPHLLRYFVVGVVTNKRKQRVMDFVSRNIRQNSYLYTDSLTNYIDRMTSADFDGALDALNECREKLFPNDMIIKNFEQEFVQCARLLFFEKFVRVHRRIDVPTLANKLCLSEKEVEQWVVDLIRNNAHFDARIDSAANQMVFGTQQQSVYQDVIEIVRTVTTKAETLALYADEYAME